MHGVATAMFNRLNTLIILDRDRLLSAPLPTPSLRGGRSCRHAVAAHGDAEPFLELVFEVVRVAVAAEKGDLADRTFRFSEQLSDRVQPTFSYGGLDRTAGHFAKTEVEKPSRHAYMPYDIVRGDALDGVRADEGYRPLDEYA